MNNKNIRYAVVMAVLMTSQSSTRAEFADYMKPDYGVAVALGATSLFVVQKTYGYLTAERQPTLEQVKKNITALDTRLKSHSALLDMVAKLPQNSPVSSENIQILAQKLTSDTQISHYKSQLYDLLQEAQSVENAHNALSLATKDKDEFDEYEQTFNQRHSSLKQLYTFVDTYEVELAYLIDKRRIQQELRVYPYGKVKHSSLYPALSQMDDLQDKATLVAKLHDQLSTHCNDVSFVEDVQKFQADIEQRKALLEQSPSYSEDSKQYRKIEPARQLKEKELNLKDRELGVMSEQNKRLAQLESRVTSAEKTFQTGATTVHIASTTMANTAQRCEVAADEITKSARNLSSINTKLDTQRTMLDSVTKAIKDLPTIFNAIMHRPPSTNPEATPPSSYGPTSLYPELHD